MNLLDALQLRHDAKVAELAGLKGAVERCEVELHRLSVALDVAQETELQDLLGELEGLPSAVPDVAVDESQDKQSVRNLVLGKLNHEVPLGKLDVLYLLERDGIKANAATVASTLSKLVRDEMIEKVGHGSYIRKRDKVETVSPTPVFYGGGEPVHDKNLAYFIHHQSGDKEFWNSVASQVKQPCTASLQYKLAVVTGNSSHQSIAEAVEKALKGGKGDAPTSPFPGATMSGEGHDLV